MFFRITACTQPKTSPTDSSVRVTRSSKARSPSPASSMISSCSSVSIVSLASTVNSSASAPKRRGRPPKNPKKAEETPLKDKTLRANELDNDDVIVLGSQANSPTSSVCSIASSTVRRSTRKTRLSLEHGSTIDASEDAGPVKSILARSNSDRKYNLRTVKKAGKEESSDEASKSEVASQEAETTKTRKTTIAKSKAVKSSVSGAHS